MSETDEVNFPDDNVVIRKYLDWAKFVSMLTTRTLYFACPTEFGDPYEGLLPKSHIDAEAKILQALVDQFLPLAKHLASQPVPAGAEELCRRSLQGLDNALERMRRPIDKEVTAKFGVSCWHEGEHESDAMWKLYSGTGQGIAIESTIGQLRRSLDIEQGLQIDRVRYMDFERDPIEKGHRHYRLFVKRKSFEHEKEVRATILLQEEGKGIPVSCNLDALITRIHISPLVECFVKDAVEALCAGKTYPLDKPVLQSSLYDPPNGEINVNTDYRHLDRP
jgi:hypothetical protein